MTGTGARVRSFFDAFGLVLKGGALMLPLMMVAFNPRQDQETQEVVADQTVIEKDSDGRWRTLLLGNVTLKGAGEEIRADRVVGWSKEEGGTFEELYAEGHVRLNREGRKIRAAAIFYDLAKQRTALLDMVVEGRSPKNGQPYYIRAAKAREIEKGRFLADDMILTTCEYAEPHSDVKIARGEIQGIEPKQRPGEFEVFPFESYELEAEDITPRVIGIPYFYWPYATYTKGQDTHVRRLRPGNSRRFGPFVLSDFGFNLTREDFETLNPLAEHDPERGKHPWGDVIVKGDYRSKRGFATGVDLDYKWDTYKGFFDSYWLIDDAGPTNTAFEHRFSSSGNRGRLKFFHRQEIDEHWRVEGELSYLSDRDLLEEFFEKEFREGKEQETTAYARYLDGNHGGFAQIRARTNDFQTQTEYLPRVGFSWIAEPIVERGLFRDMTITGSGELANLETRFAERLNRRDQHTWRFDGRAEFDMPFDADPVTYLPFVGSRLTVYSNTGEGDADARFIGTAGVRAKSSLARVFDVEADELGIHGLRHQMNFGGGILGNVYSNVGRAKFFPHDEIDSAARFGEFYVETQQRLETKLLSPDGTLTRHQFLYASVGLEYYPGGASDTTRANPNNAMPPFNWISVFPDTNGRFRPRHFSDLYWELSVTPKQWAQFSITGTADPERGREVTRFAGLNVTPAADMQIGLSHAYVRGVTNSYGATARIKVAEKWTVGGGLGYDTQRGDFINQSVFVERDYHDFLLRAQFLRDFGRNDSSFTVEVVPKFLEELVGPSPRGPYALGFGGESLGSRQGR